MVDEHNFEDRALFYRFRQDGKYFISVVLNNNYFLEQFLIKCLWLWFYNTRYILLTAHSNAYPCLNSCFYLDPPHLSPAGPSVASLKKDCGTKFGPAQKKGLLMWQQAFIVLRQGDDTLYEFRTYLV